jgi:deoxyribonuclease-4
MSIAGGFHKAVIAAEKVGCDVLQIFTASPNSWPKIPGPETDVRSARLSTKNNNQWNAKPLTDADCNAFKKALVERKITHPISHNSYLINLGTPDDELWKKSIDAMVVELQRAEQLGIPYVVAHPGAFTTSSEEAGLKRIAKGLDEVHKQTKKVAAHVLLETTAGQGSHLGWRFEHLAEIIAKAKDPDRIGVCFDTCHVFSAGYAMTEKKDYQATMREFDKIVGCDRIQAFHLNDSLKPFGARKDRHAAIGEGEMGLEPFRHLLNDKRFKKTPMYLETPKGIQDGEDLDVINLRTLRSLVV